MYAGVADPYLLNHFQGLTLMGEQVAQLCQSQKMAEQEMGQHASP